MGQPGTRRWPGACGGVSMGGNGRGVCPLDSTDLVLFHPKDVSIFSITSAGWEMEVPVQH